MYSGKKLHKKIAATRAALFDSNMHRIVCRLAGWGFASDPLGSLQHSPRPLAVFRGPTSKEGKRKGGKG